MDTLTESPFPLVPIVAVGFIAAVVIVVCVIEWLSRKGKRGVPSDSLTSVGGFAVPFSSPIWPSPIRDALPIVTAVRGDIEWGGPLRLAFDWDWPEAPAVSAPDAPAAMPDHWPAWRMANWTREEWREFERAVARRP